MFGFLGSSHAFPEEGMVVVPSTIVTDSSAVYAVGDTVKDVNIVTVMISGFIKVGGVRYMMFIMMEFHGGLVNNGFQCVIVIG